MDSAKICRNGRGFVSIVVVTLFLSAMFLFFGCTKEKPRKELSETLTILNWEDYIEVDVVKEFEEKNITLMSSLCIMKTKTKW